MNLFKQGSICTTATGGMTVKRIVMARDLGRLIRTILRTHLKSRKAKNQEVARRKCRASRAKI